MRIPINPVLTFTYSVLSVLFCWLYGIPGVALAVVAWIEAKRLEPEIRKEKWLNLLQKAKILAIIGFICSLIFTVYYVIAFARGTFIRW